jgi:hypothetical protein
MDDSSYNLDIKNHEHEMTAAGAKNHPGLSMADQALVRNRNDQHASNIYANNSKNETAADLKTNPSSTSIPQPQHQK